MKNSDFQYLLDRLKVVISPLDEQELSIIERRFGIKDDVPATLETVSIDFSINRDDVRACESRSLRKLRLNTLETDDFFQSLEKVSNEDE